MKTGEVYILGERRNGGTGMLLDLVPPSGRIHARVICFDAFEVFAETKGIHEPWMEEPRQSFGFGRFPRNVFDAWSYMVGFRPYSEEHLQLLKPHLPIRLGRLRTPSWGNSLLDSQDDIKEYFRELKRLDRTVHTAHVYLVPICSNQRLQQPMLLTAGNRSYFMESELLFWANITQAGLPRRLRCNNKGTGMYRYGMRNGVPLYHVWGFFDQANYLAVFEKEGAYVDNV